jgi:hypothetical protein
MIASSPSKAEESHVDSQSVSKHDISLPIRLAPVASSFPVAETDSSEDESLGLSDHGGSPSRPFSIQRVSRETPSESKAAERKRKLARRLRPYLKSLYQSSNAQDTGIQTHTNNSYTGSAATYQPSFGVEDGNQQRQGRKRVRGAKNTRGSGQDEPDDNSDDNPDSVDSKGESPSQTSKAFRFACPYAKRDPILHEDCQSRSWPNVSRLK